MSERKLVRARQRSIEDLPDWCKCCPQMIERIEQVQHKEFIATLPTFPADVRCPYCGRVEEDVLYRDTIGPIRTVIAVVHYEWDEGSFDHGR